MPLHDDRLTVLDLFSGAGGMALGFESAGFRCVGSVELDQAASTTFSRMFAHEKPAIFGGPADGNIIELNHDRLREALPTTPDIIVGGPPCQGFSRIGRAKQASLVPEEERHLRSVRDPRRNELYKDFFQVVRTFEPLAFVVENVPGLLRDNRGQNIAYRVAEEGRRAGYQVRYFLLNSVHYGVPQIRWRLFFVGFHVRSLGVRAIPTPPPRSHEWPISLPEATPHQEDRRFLAGQDIPALAELAPAVTVGEALADLPKLRGHRSRNGRRGVQPVEQPMPYRREAAGYGAVMRHWPGRKPPEMVNGNWYRWTPRDFPTFAAMAVGDKYPEALAIANARFRTHLESLSKRGGAPEVGSHEYDELAKQFVPPYRNDAFDDKWHKLDPDRPSWTVTAHLSKDTYSHIHFDSRQARTITIREAARLQSFPDAFTFSGNFGQQYRQIGNAVPPLLARAIAVNLRQQLSELGCCSTDRAA